MRTLRGQHLREGALAHLSRSLDDNRREDVQEPVAELLEMAPDQVVHKADTALPERSRAIGRTFANTSPNVRGTGIERSRHHRMR